MADNEKSSVPRKPRGIKKRKSSEYSGDTGKRRKLDQVQHVPTLVSSTFNPLEEVDFPREGSSLTPMERKQVENEASKDDLFEVCGF